MIARPYQQEALDQTEAEIVFGGTNLVLSAPTSWGKSFYIAKICEKYDLDRIVIMVNIDELIDQISEALTSIKLDHSILKAGREAEFDSTKRIQIVMSHTFYSRYSSIDILAAKLIIDERHKEYNTPRTMKLVEALEPEAIIGTSATPYDNQGFMLDGCQIIETATGQSLTDDGYLCPLHYYTTRWSERIDYSKVKRHGGDYTTGALDEIINTPRHIEMIADSMDQLNAKSKKTLVFCSSIAQADAISKELEKRNYSVEAYHSKRSKKDNASIIDSFKNNTPYSGSEEEKKSVNLFTDDNDNIINNAEPIKCLVSINKVAIGFSQTDIQLGVILRPSKIRSLMVQIAGRMKRIDPSKEFTEVLDCAQMLSTHGFVDTDHYEPPIKTEDTDTNKANIDNATRHLKLEGLSAIANKDNSPTLITKKIFKTKSEEIINNRTKLSNMTLEELVDTLEFSKDPVMMIAIVAVLFEKVYGNNYIAKNGKQVSNFCTPKSITWVSELWTELLPKQSDFNRRKYIKALRTRGKNLVKDRGSFWSLRFFIEFLIKEDSVEYTEDPEDKTYTVKVDGIEIDIDDADIPF